MVPNLIDPPLSNEAMEFNRAYYLAREYVAQQMKLRLVDGKRVLTSHGQVEAFNARVAAVMKAGE